MSSDAHVLVGFVAIVLLTIILVIANVHTAVLRFYRDKNGSLFLVCLGSLVLLVFLIFRTTSRLFGQIMDVNASQTAALHTPE